LPRAPTPHRQARPSRRGLRFLLKSIQYLCGVVAIVCLGYVALDYGYARFFQFYQGWRFDRIIRHEAASPGSLLGQWADRAVFALRNKAAGKLRVNDFRPQARALAGHGSAPAPPALPALPPPVTNGPALPAPRFSVPTLPELPVGLSSLPAAPAYPSGFLIGRLEIPRLGVSVMVLEGDDAQVLKKGVGHVPSTAFPGSAGNVVLAGHRDTFFRRLRKICKGDEITFTNAEGVFKFRVESTEKVGPRDVQLLEPSTHSMLTLITCYPFDYIGPAPQRFVVRADETAPSGALQSERLASVQPAAAASSNTPSTSSPQPGRPPVDSSLPPSTPSFTRIDDSARRATGRFDELSRRCQELLEHSRMLIRKYRSLVPDDQIERQLADG